MTEKETEFVKTRGPKGTTEDAKITLLVEGNPKRAGSKAAEAFANYEDGMTVGDFIQAVGKEATSHLVYDAKHGFIKIDGYDPEVIPPKEPKPKKEKAPKEAKEKAPKEAKKPKVPVATEVME